MDVSEFLQNHHHDNLFSEEVSGWLAILNRELYLIEENCLPDYQSAVRLKIADQRLKYLLRGSVLLLGGPSFIFHRARIRGVMKCASPMEFSVSHATVDCERSGIFSMLDCSEPALEAARMRYEAEFLTASTSPWA